MALGLFPSSLRSRVLSIVFVAGFPLFCFLFFVHWRWQQAEIAQAHQDARRLADFAALEEQHLIEQARQLLINLAQFPQVRHGDATACSQIFANLLPQYPAYANFGAIRANGEIFCSGVPLPKAEMTQTSPLKICFDKATEMKEFTIGDYAIGRLTGRPVLLMAYPASVDSDSIQTVVFAALDLAWLNQFAASAGLPHGATLTVVDRNGVVLAHHPESEAWVGKSATELPLVHSVLLRGETEASSANGETPIFALSSLPGAAHAKDTHVVVSIPKTSVLAGVEDAFIYSVFTFIGVVLLAGGLAWGGSTRLLVQPINRLLATTRKVAAGDMHARTGERYSPGELGTLARAFDDMAESLARREAEREQKEEALRESEERLRKLAETAPGAIHTLRVWPDGRRCFTYASPGIKAIYGFSPEELAKDAWPTFALMHPDDIERVHATTSEAIRTLSPWRCEFRVQLPEKGEIWVEGCSTPIREPDDSISWHGFLTDITERKRAESALRRSTERLQILHAIDCAILEAQSPSAIAQAALQRLRAVVPYTLSSIIFFDSEARVGRVFAVDPVVADQGAETSTYPLVGLRHVEAVLQGGEVFSEPDIKTKAQDIPAYAILQRQGICSLIAAPLVVEGALIGALGLGADRCDAFNPDHSEIILQVAVPLALAIQHARLNEQLLTQQRGETERVEAELARARQQLVQQTRLAAIGQVSASIAHDLRNPLGAIRNAAYLLKHRLPQEDSKWAEYLQVVEEEVLNADRIIGDLMEMTRAKAPTKQAVDLVALVRDIFHRSNLSNEVHWRCVCDPDPFLIWADPGQIRQVLNNLLLNAAQAMEEHGTIEVKAMRRAEWDVITVADTGPGVAPEDWQRIFEPLFTTKAKGTGLGLAICKQLIERHGGAIEMIPSHGFGSVFCIRLPRGQAAVSVMQATVS